MEETITNESIIDPIQDAQPPVSKEMKLNWLGIVLVAAAIAVFSIVSFYAGSKLNKSQTTAIPVTSVEQENLITSTSDGEMYTSSKASYSFKYPKEWPLVSVPPSIGCDICIEQISFTPEYNPQSSDATIAVILVFKYNKIKTLEDYVNTHVNGDSLKTDVQSTKVGGERAVSYTLSEGIPPLPIIEYAVVKNEMYYIIRLVDSTETNKNRDNNLKLFNDMLTTFDFLN